MNNKVNDVFLDNDKELLVGDKIVLESDQGITNDEKDILESIFDKIKENNLENKPIKFSLDKYSKDAIISLQNNGIVAFVMRGITRLLYLLMILYLNI